MTYHRTGGKGGTRNSPRERHADRFLPNHNKRRGSGKIARGRRVDNPGRGSSPRERYDDMMAEAREGIAPRRSGADVFFGGESGVDRPIDPYPNRKRK